MSVDGAHENTGCRFGTVLLFDGLFSTGTDGAAFCADTTKHAVAYALVAWPSSDRARQQ